ncbi:MAG: hypothetical protein AAFZ09_15860, partial [Pseudomonadota bacterium]
MSDRSAGPIRLTGYTDRLSARPGERMRAFVSSRLDGPYRAELVRIVSGDPNPDGPGRDIRPVAGVPATDHLSRVQPVSLGSCAVVEGLERAGVLDRVRLSVTIWPTLPVKRGGGRQAVLALASSEGPTIVLGLDEAGRPAVWLGGATPALHSEHPLAERRWVRLQADIDLDASTAELAVIPMEAASSGQV